MKIFINKYGRLRSGWRLVLFALALIAINLLIQTVVRLAYAVLHDVGPNIPYADLLSDLVYRFTLLFSALGAGYLCLRLLEGLPWRALGLSFHQRWFRDFSIGTLIGIFSLALAVLIATLGGGLQLLPPAAGSFVPVIRTLIGSAILFIVAALAEEAIFRGYPMQTLSRAGLAWLAILLTSVPFALVHLGNPNVVPVFTFANTALAGVWLAVAYLRTRSLWLPWGVHWAWNWALGSLFGLPVSGMTVGSHPLLLGKDLGPAWLTGGSYGIEGGAACTVALIVSTLILWKLPLLTATAELKQMTSQENPVSQSLPLSITATPDS